MLYLCVHNAFWHTLLFHTLFMLKFLSYGHVHVTWQCLSMLHYHDVCANPHVHRVSTSNLKILTVSPTLTSRSRSGRRPSATRKTTFLATSIQSSERCSNSRPLSLLTTPSLCPSWTGTASLPTTSSARPRLTWKTGFSASTVPPVVYQRLLPSEWTVRSGSSPGHSQLFIDVACWNIEKLGVAWGWGYRSYMCMCRFCTMPVMIYSSAVLSISHHCHCPWNYLPKGVPWYCGMS